MIHHISLLLKDAHFGFRHLLSVCKRLNAKDSRCVINEYKRLIEDSNIDSQGFIIFGQVVTMVELRK